MFFCVTSCNFFFLHSFIHYLLFLIIFMPFFHDFPDFHLILICVVSVYLYFPIFLFVHLYSITFCCTLYAIWVLLISFFLLFVYKIGSNFFCYPKCLISKCKLCLNFSNLFFVFFCLFAFFSQNENYFCNIFQFIYNSSPFFNHFLPFLYLFKFLD